MKKNVLQSEINALSSQFKVKKPASRIVYQQPKKVNGKDTYQQPRTEKINK